jgi:hypothetical protein
MLMEATVRLQANAIVELFPAGLLSDAHAATQLARERRHQRLVRHTRQWLRYERRHGRKHLKHAHSCGNQNAAHPRGAYEGAEACGCRRHRCGISGTFPGMIIMDDPHAEMPNPQVRATMLAWHEKHLRR